MPGVLPVDLIFLCRHPDSNIRVNLFKCCQSAHLSTDGMTVSTYEITLGDLFFDSFT